MPYASITSTAVCAFPGCGRKHRARGLCGGHYAQARMGKDLRALRADRDHEADFWAKVDRSGGPDACWPWTAERDANGYGQVRIKGRVHGAHRVAYTLVNGPIPKGEGYHGTCILHRCDNPPCCNVLRCLFPGTNAENVADKMAKGRHRGAVGKENSSAKLTEADIPNIRARAARESQRAIARAFGISQHTVHRIVRRKTWRHISEETSS